MSQSANDCVWVHYKFTLPENRVREFHVRLDRTTLRLLAEPRAVYPEWVRLAYQQCPNCVLSADTHPHCPVAANLVEVVEYFRQYWSCEEAEVQVATEARTVTKKTAVQNGLSSLAGLYMATSGCPTLDKLRPLAFTHLPFGGLEETLYRAVSMYALAQVFRRNRGKPPDWDLTGLGKIYEDIEAVNRAFYQRIFDVTAKEAGHNALIQLNCYAQYTNGRFLQKRLGQIEQFFDAYLD